MKNRIKVDEFSKVVLKWSKKNQRDFPWRRNISPYRILIAEIMLQRTKADQVVPIYTSFLEKFPDLKSLAQASEEDIANLFCRLGLIHRAKLVRILANDLETRFSGEIPNSREDLLSLPAIGEYVADTMLCFAFNRDVAIIDTNVCRVLGRAFGLKANGEARRDQSYRKLAESLLPIGKCKEFNWALIDHASLICLPRNPKCKNCPLNGACCYFQNLVKDTLRENSTY
jgi:A/G-specific adenine glycosylase